MKHISNIDKYDVYDLSNEISNVKLIASDMDGTLLNSDHSLPDDFFDILKKLEKNGTHFVVASGRAYYTLYKNFQPYSDHISYICENGACVVENGKMTYKNMLSKEHLKKCIDLLYDIDDIYVVLCGSKGAYILDLPEWVEEIDSYYSNRFIVEDLRDIDDDIFKIGIYDTKTPHDNSYKRLFPYLNEDLSLVISGKYWLDIMNKDVNKGVALQNIQKQFNVGYDETMAFGDFYNDIELLSMAKYSFVMENANEDMKIYGKYIAPPNTQCGVTEIIKKYVLK